MSRTLLQTTRQITSRGLFWEGLVLLAGMGLGLAISIKVAAAWAGGCLVMMLALYAQERVTRGETRRLSRGVLAKWLVIGAGFSAVFLGWQAVSLSALIGGSVALNLVRPLRALWVSLRRRRGRNV